MIGVRAGRETLAPVMTGSHIDTVRTGGRYDGNYGVLAGLEVVRALNAAGITTRRPLAVAFFTNEEGARFQPDMMGSLVYAGGLGLSEAYAAIDKDGQSVGDEGTARLYREVIQPEEVHHHHLGRRILEKYATTPELQELVAQATRNTLAIADELRTLAEKTTGVMALPVS